MTDKVALWRRPGLYVIGLVLLVIVLYYTIPYVRYLFIPLTGGTKAPNINQAISAQTVTTQHNKQFVVGTLANSKQVVSSISQVPAEGGWINTSPLNFAALRKQHKVILIDFWTYSCINCIRATPYSEQLWQRYKNHGLVVIGVHSPEFAFEHSPKNIAKAVKALGITYPVLTDANMDIWRAFGNHFWPGKYLINPQGKVVFTQFGEGDYAHEEQVVRKTLAKAHWALPPEKPTGKFLQPLNKAQTDELYAGPGFIRSPYGNHQQPAIAKVTHFHLPKKIGNNKIYLSGQWLGSADYVQAKSAGEIVLKYLASTPYIVLSDSQAPLTVAVLWDGKPVPKAYRGRDIVVKQGKTYLQVGMPRLYYPLSATAPYGQHQIRFLTPKGLKFYSFTFGSYAKED